MTQAGVLADRPVRVDPIRELAQRRFGLSHADRVVGIGGIPAATDADRGRHESVGGERTVDRRPRREAPDHGPAQLHDAESLTGLRRHQELGPAQPVGREHRGDAERGGRPRRRGEQDGVARLRPAQAGGHLTHHEGIRRQVLGDVVAHRAGDDLVRQHRGAHRVGEAERWELHRRRSAVEARHRHARRPAEGERGPGRTGR